MGTIYRQIAFHRLSDTQKQAKLQKDSEYEIAVMNLYATLPKKHAEVKKKKLWEDYLEWAKANDLYEEITLQQQLAEIESRLSEDIEQINLIRTELNKPLLELKEKSVVIEGM